MPKYELADSGKAVGNHIVRARKRGMFKGQCHLYRKDGSRSTWLDCYFQCESQCLKPTTSSIPLSRLMPERETSASHSSPVCVPHFFSLAFGRNLASGMQ